MRSIPQHLAPWRDSAEWRIFPSVLVLGATGRLGRILRAVWPAHWPVTWCGRRGGDVICNPLEDPGTFRDTAQRADVILSLAGPAPGGALQGEADLTDHARLARVVMEHAKGPVLLASSAAVYGNAGASGTPLREGMPLPTDVSTYGAAKREMEQAAPDAVCLRIGNVAGVDAILGGWKEGFSLDTFSDGTTPRRSYIGPLTLAYALAKLCCEPHDLPKCLNVAEAGSVEMGALLKAAGLPFNTRKAPDNAIPDVTLDTTRLIERIPSLSEPVVATRLVEECRLLRERA
ncbi:MAG: NAD-dependent epimerase/dehydratase family protein [Pseudomonadota bacterium]